MGPNTSIRPVGKTCEEKRHLQDVAHAIDKTVARAQSEEQTGADAGLRLSRQTCVRSGRTLAVGGLIQNHGRHVTDRRKNPGGCTTAAHSDVENAKMP